MTDLRVTAAGDSALLLELPARIDPGINDSAIALARALESRAGAVLRDVVVGYSSVTLYFDPLAIDAGWLEAEAREIAGALEPPPPRPREVIDVPVCYGGELGPDLSAVATFGGCTDHEVIELHAAVTYRVFLLGFVPGFAYMGEVDARIAAPRRSSPRPAVAAGSVGIAGGQTGIYPAVTPGGWNIIGRTFASPFDLRRPDPFLFRAGDRVRFRPITREEFDRHGS